MRGAIALALCLAASLVPTASSQPAVSSDAAGARPAVVNEAARSFSSYPHATAATPFFANYPAALTPAEKSLVLKFSFASLFGDWRATTDENFIRAFQDFAAGVSEQAVLDALAGAMMSAVAQRWDLPRPLGLRERIVVSDYVSEFAPGSLGLDLTVLVVTEDEGLFQPYARFAGGRSIMVSPDALKGKILEARKEEGRALLVIAPTQVFIEPLEFLSVSKGYGRRALPAGTPIGVSPDYFYALISVHHVAQQQVVVYLFNPDKLSFHRVVVSQQASRTSQYARYVDPRDPESAGLPTSEPSNDFPSYLVARAHIRDAMLQMAQMLVPLPADALEDTLRNDREGLKESAQAQGVAASRRSLSIAHEALEISNEQLAIDRNSARGR